VTSRRARAPGAPPIIPRPPRAPGVKAPSTPSSRRDTEASAFSPILLDFISRVPGALGAVLVDRDGEAVDYAGRGDPYDLKLSAAHWQIVLRELVALAALRDLGTARSLSFRGERRSTIAHVLPDGYVLVLLLGRRAGFTPSTRALAVCERALATEAGWPLLARSPTWFPANVLATRAGRPGRVRDAGRDHSLEVLGRVGALAPREAGWRVRLENGAELMLVREPGGHWYADEPIAALFTREP
jgi:hypothetical protein